MGFFTVIRRPDQALGDDITPYPALVHQDTICDRSSKAHNLQIVPYSKEYNALLIKAADFLRKAGSFVETPRPHSRHSLESMMRWPHHKSSFSVTIYRQELEVPLDTKYKSKGVKASPIRVMQLIYNAGDVKGPQTVAFDLPNDERIVKEHGSAMVMMKNVSEAKFCCILQPIAQVCLSELQQKDVDFESFFTHTVCHECCHGIGPHTIILPNGKETTVRLVPVDIYPSLDVTSQLTAIF